jgi:hypothetical protein
MDLRSPLEFSLGARDLVRNHGETNARNIVVVGSAQLLYQVDGR